MAVNDKLHKLYSSTLEPIVWARTVGLEVLNELDTLKASIIMTAGGGSRRESGSTWGTAFTAAASGVEGLFTVSDTAKMVRNGAIGLAAHGLQQLLKQHAPSEERRRE
jgi:ubiquinone biosynthesis monooxygenase Coq6